MLLQTLLSVAFIAVLAGGLVAGALVDVKVATNQIVARATTDALARGTDEFVNYAQLYVAKHGASSAWPSTTVTDQPQAICPGATASGTCGEFATISYAVIGSSAGATSGPDPVTNLQVAVNENRIAGTVTATITSADGTVQGSRTRRVTLRVFDASPFAVLTGAREATSIASSVEAEEGDSGGYFDLRTSNFLETPDPKQPSRFRDTTIRVYMTCQNSIQNANQFRPFLDNNPPGNDARMWGNSGGTAFEAPCAPSYAFSATPALPLGASLNTNNNYDISVRKDASWTSRSSTMRWPR